MGGPPAPSPPIHKPQALLIDEQWPRADRDSGSIDIFNLAKALVALGFHVRFAAWGSGASPPEDPVGRAALEALGITCITQAETPVPEAFLEREGGQINLVVLNRVYCGGHFMEAVRRHCTAARVLFNTIDLNYLRLLREARLYKDAKQAAIAEETRRREEWLAREADLTIVVSETEAQVLAQAVPDAAIVVLPLARATRPPQAGFDARRGIGFVGGFAHAPNVDAVRFFLDEVWPLILDADPTVRFSIVGAGLPPEVLDAVPGQVEYLGPLPDIQPWLETLRLTVAPLRYGAGVKGKVVSSLAAGVPCVATPIATEGMGFVGGGGVLEAATPEDLAAAILRVHNEPELWSALSASGLSHIAAHFSPDAWRARLHEALWTVGALQGTQAPAR